MNRQAFPAIIDTNQKIALVEGDRQLSYAQLGSLTACFATGLLNGQTDLKEERIAFFLPAGIDYVMTMHGVWLAGGIAVPLNIASAVSELEHYLSCAGVTRMIAGEKRPQGFDELCESLSISVHMPEEFLANEIAALPAIDADRRAMILFTSGTTNKPKGVVSTHHTIACQITTLLDAWAWHSDDVIPLFLPVHHIHGIVNILSCGLWAGATVHLFAKFDAPTLSGQIAANTYTVFMAVPTIYVKLLQYFDTLEQNDIDGIVAGFKAMRLNISGSAACPVKLFEQWQQLTGQVLLERYGMTEIGMGISNPYDGERRAGHVGQSLPGVEAGLFDEQDNPITAENTPGEIRIKGDNVFLEYWQNPEATHGSFKDGWFCTGDVAVIEGGYYRIMGRASIDIIKSGGYKLSALEIEGTLLQHEQVSEVAVIGVEDETWGERVVAFVVTAGDATLAFDELKAWCARRMSSYKIPKQLEVVDSLPRNAMGKVTKPDLKKRLA